MCVLAEWPALAFANKHVRVASCKVVNKLPESLEPEHSSLRADGLTQHGDQPLADRMVGIRDEYVPEWSAPASCRGP